MPLIDAAISRKFYYRNRDDLRQECVVKLLYALPKFNPERGAAFAFLWTTICNTCNTQDQKLTRNNDVSISTDEGTLREVENNSSEIYHTPENAHILNVIGSDIHKVFQEIEVLENTNSRKQRRIHRELKGYISSGELFYDKELVVRKLRAQGLRRKEVQFYVDKALILVRQKLLAARENALAIQVREANSAVSQDVGT